MMTVIEYAKPVVAIENEFLDSLLRLPKKIQKKTREFLDKFRNDPRSPGINLERVKNSRDGKLYSARIDQQYRAIVAYQKETGVYLLLYVDNHDDAYVWATKKYVQVNPRTNTIQVYQYMDEKEQAERLQHLQNSDSKNNDVAVADAMKAIVEPAVSTTATENTAPASIKHAGRLAEEYSQLTDDDMLAFGVPSIYVPIMLNQYEWRPFSSWLERLPSDAKVYLQLAAEGTPKKRHI